VRLFAVKGRPPEVALPILVADAGQAAELAGTAGWTEAARRLAERYWPGALTVVVYRRPGLEWDLGGDPSTIGLRCPANAAARALCREVGPLATTSANRHGEPSCTTAAEVRTVFGPELLVVDDGPGQGVASTVVDLTGRAAGIERRGAVSLLRQGAVSFDEVAQLLAEL